MSERFRGIVRAPKPVTIRVRTRRGHMQARVKMCVLLVVIAGAAAALAQSAPPAVPQTPAPQTPPPAARPTPPTRDPGTPGYVSAKELPDGAVPPADAEGNFIIGPTHAPAPEATVREGVPQ